MCFCPKHLENILPKQRLNALSGRKNYLQGQITTICPFNSKNVCISHKGVKKTSQTLSKQNIFSTQSIHSLKFPLHLPIDTQTAADTSLIPSVELYTIQQKTVLRNKTMIAGIVRGHVTIWKRSESWQLTAHFSYSSQLTVYCRTDAS